MTKMENHRYTTVVASSQPMSRSWRHLCYMEVGIAAQVPKLQFLQLARERDVVLPHNTDVTRISPSRTSTRAQRGFCVCFLLHKNALWDLWLQVCVLSSSDSVTIRTTEPSTTLQLGCVLSIEFEGMEA